MQERCGDLSRQSRRRVWLSVVILFGLFVPGISVTLAAQEDRVVEMDTLNVRDVLYHLAGGGANGLALIDEVSINSGVVLIDTKPAGWAEATLEVIGQVTDFPVVTIINTNGDERHAGSNADYGEPQQIIAHENTAARLERSGRYGTSGTGLPTVTFSDHHSILDDLDRIDLYFFGSAYTDGDVVVVFPEKQTAYLGDLFPDKGIPAIDSTNGGSGLEFPETLRRVRDEISDINRVITGHGPFPTTYAGRGRREQGANRMLSGFYTWDDFTEYVEFVELFVTSARESFEAGRTQTDAVAAFQPLDTFSDYDLSRVSEAMAIIYTELEAQE